MFIKATSYDQYLAVAYFQEGVSNFLLGKFEDASENFNDALMVYDHSFYLTTVPPRKQVHKL
jgi:hypothetical protein